MTHDLPRHDSRRGRRDDPGLGRHDPRGRRCAAERRRRGSGADLQPRRRADRLREVRRAATGPAKWRRCRSSSYQGRAAVGRRDSREGRGARDAAVARRPQPTARSATTRACSQAEIDTIVRWVDARRARGRPEGRAGAAHVRRGLADRQAGRGVRDAGRLRGAGATARSTISTSRCRPTSPRTAGCRPAKCAPAIARTCTTSSSTCASRSRSPRPTVVSVRPILAAGQRRRRAPAAAPRGTASAHPAAGAAAGGAASRTSDNMLVNWAVGEDAPVYLPGTAKRIPAGSTLHLPGALHDQRHAGQATGRGSGSIFAKEPPSQEIRTGVDRQPAVRDSAGGASQPPGGGRSHVHRGREGVDHAPAHAPARQGHDLHGHLSRRPARDRAAGAEVRLRLADRLLAGRAAGAAEGLEDPRRRALRQLGGQPGQSRSDGDGPLGRSDLGRDDDRLLHLHGGRARTQARAILDDRAASSR